MHSVLVDARTWGTFAGILAGGVALVLLLHHYFFVIADKLSKRRESRFGATLLKYVRIPTRVMVILGTAATVLLLAPLSETARAVVIHSAELAAIAAVGWLFIALAKFVSRLIEHRYAVAGEDTLIARRIRTQTQVIQRIVNIGIILVTIGAMLMTFPNVRQIGASMLASAGIAGLVAGIAARSTFASLIAGLQVALTQPIRLEDSVVVEGEWGWIEEIGTTYVVVRLWDLRRLIVPLTYFIEKPFQNWTRTTSDLLGTAMIYADYTVPVEEVRQELRRVLEETPLWDRRVCSLQVTDLSENTVQLRALMSASNSSRAFDLRCLVRERLVHFLQDKYPQCLPTKRGHLAISKEELMLTERI
jgi:small-conductance mechanosensitive channel